MVVEAGDGGQIGSDASVNRGHVIGDVGAATKADALCGGVDARCMTQDQPGVGKAAEADEVDHHVAAGVVPGDMTGQHAGIGGDGVGVDQGQPHAGHGIHPPHAQQQRMGMAAPDKDQIGDAGLWQGLDGRGPFGFGADITAELGDGESAVAQI